MPKKSLVVSGPTEALLGPDSDPNSAIECTGKEGRLYNNGDSLTYYVTGPAADCAGVSYLAPFVVEMKTKGKRTTFSLAFPDNISHPIPGIQRRPDVADLRRAQANREKEREQDPLSRERRLQGRHPNDAVDRHGHRGEEGRAPTWGGAPEPATAAGRYARPAAV